MTGVEAVSNGVPGFRPPEAKNASATLVAMAPDAGADMTFDFPQLIAHIVATRNVRAGTIVGSGTVSNRDRTLGSSCIAEQRALEQMEHGEARTGFLRFG